MKSFPKIPPKFKMLTSWLDGAWIWAVAENKKENKVVLYRWDGIAQTYNDFWVFEKYE